jgi:hypothetical protein
MGGKAVKPFIKIGDTFVNISTILYIEKRSDGNLWVAFDLDHQKGILVEGEQASELHAYLGPLAAFSV